jgi:hypothetical protein
MTDDQNHVPLCDLAKTRFCEMDRRVNERFKAMQLAIDKTEHNILVRLEQMNEFRRQILEERAGYPTRRELLAVGTIIISIVIAMFTYLVGRA